MSFSEDYETQTIQGQLHLLSRLMTGRCFIQIQKAGIHPKQVPILHGILQNPGCTQKELAGSMCLSPPTIHVSVQRLEKAGLIRLENDPDHPRSVRLYLTETGEAAVTTCISHIQKDESVLLNGFTDTELCLLSRFLKQMTDNLQNTPNH